MAIISTREDFDPAVRGVSDEVEIHWWIRQRIGVIQVARGYSRPIGKCAVKNLLES